MKTNLPLRCAALRLLANGSASMAEVAKLAGVSRQVVRHWALESKINADKMRRSRLWKLWTVAYGEANRDKL